MDKKLGRYSVEKLIAEGAVGKIYLCTDPKLSRRVAIKVLAEDAEEALRRRFLLEARAIAALEHPNIVGLHDYSGEESSTLYLVMEYVPGQSLYKLALERGNMSETTALCVGHEIALALEHAHRANVVHRDIKPENILLFEGRLVLTDFGGVKIHRPRNKNGAVADPSVTEVLGTPGFMAPEQFSGRDVAPHSDLFGLGAVMYNLTTGRIPYEGGSVDTLYKNLKRGRYTDPRDHAQLLSPEFSRLLSRCLAPRPRDRYADAGNLRAEIAQLLRSLGVTDAREELARYELNPAGLTVKQRERAVDVAIKELHAALNSRDSERANALLQRVRLFSPLDTRAELADSTLMPQVVAPKPTGLRFFHGLALGAGLGLLGMMLVYFLAARSGL